MPMQRMDELRTKSRMGFPAPARITDHTQRNSTQNTRRSALQMIEIVITQRHTRCRSIRYPLGKQTLTNEQPTDNIQSTFGTQLRQFTYHRGGTKSYPTRLHLESAARLHASGPSASRTLSNNPRSSLRRTMDNLTRIRVNFLRHTN